MMQKTDKRIIFVRGVLWFGIIADFLNVLQYCFPESLMKPLGVLSSVTPGERFILIQAAVLMSAWTLLLIWAERRPLERRQVLVFTVPIALGIAGSAYYLIASNILAKSSASLIVAPLITAGLFLSAYFVSGRIRRSESEKIITEG